jgi:hypothetical protein
MTPQAGSIAVLICALLTSLARSAEAQSSTAPVAWSRAPEAFVHTGVFGAGSDEGRIGKAISVGGAITVPLAWRLAADFDVQTSRLSRSMGRPEDVYQTRRTLLASSVLYRRGRGSLYGYVGGGIVAEFDRSTYLRGGLPYEEQFNRNGTPSFRGGIAGFPVRRLGFRADLYMAGWHLGARIGVGYRFR